MTRSQAEKKLRRLRKAVNRRPLPAYIDLVRWLKDRGHAQTTGGANRLLVAGRVRSDSHTVGRMRGPKDEWVPARLVPANLRERLVVDALSE